MEDCSLRLHWPAPNKVGYGGYPTIQRSESAIARAKALFHGYFVVAELYIGLPSVGMHTVRFSNLPPNTSDAEMEYFAKPEAMMWEVPPYDSLPSVARQIRRQIHRLYPILEWHVNLPPFTRGTVTATATFDAPSTAADATAAFHNHPLPCIGGSRLQVFHMRELIFRLSESSYRPIKSDIQQLGINIDAQSSGLAGIRVTGMTPQEVHQIRLFSSDLKQLACMKADVEKIQRGQVAEYEGEPAWDSSFDSADGDPFFQTLQKKYPEATITRDPILRSITLHGPSALRTQIQGEIVQKVQDLCQPTTYHIPLDPPALTSFSDTTTYADLTARLGPNVLSLDKGHSTLIIRGTDAQYDLVTSVIVNGQPLPPRHLGKTCPICLTLVERSLCVLKCGHTYCRSCLKRYILISTSYPLTCIENAGHCPTAIPLAVARELLSREQLRDVITSAYSAFVSTRPNVFHPCPTPNCPQTHRTSSSHDNLRCPGCLETICSGCHREHHEGRPDIQQQEHAFQEWKDAHDVKPCPGCKVNIERAAGCNHVTCSHCKTHICWVCSGAFSDAKAAYEHMHSVHGGIGLAEEA